MNDVNFLISNGIDVDGSLDILGDIDMYNDTLNDFYLEFFDRMERIDDAFNSHDMDLYSIDVHAMKGDSKYLGFTKLADISLEHQLKSQSNDLDYIFSHYDEFVSEANKIIGIVSKYLGK